MVLALCALLLNNGVVCQDPDASSVPPAHTASVDPSDATPSEAGAVGGPGSTAVTASQASDVPLSTATDSTDAQLEITRPTADAPADPPADPPADLPANTGTPVLSSDGHGGAISTLTTSVLDHVVMNQADTSVTTESMIIPGAGSEIKSSVVTNAPAQPTVTEAAPAPVMVKPVVVCVKEEDMKDKDAVQVGLQQSSSCELSKAVFERLLAPWCSREPCQLEVFQEDSSNTLLVSSPNAGIKQLEETLNTAEVKAKLGVSKVEAQPGKSSSAVFVSVLMAGLLLAAGLIGAYCLRIRRGHNTKGMRLAEETYPADEENQGNTLVSVAPLTPSETQEKPAVNGEAPEADKTQPPPTNGHSTKTADTEL